MPETITIKRIFDKDLILRTYLHPRIFPNIKDDYTPPKDKFDININNYVHYLGIFYKENYAGFTFFHPLNAVMFQAHPCFLPVIWGRLAIVAGKKCIKYFFENTICANIIGCVPDGQTLAHRLAKNIGMKPFGYNNKCFISNGELKGMTYYRIDKEMI